MRNIMVKGGNITVIIDWAFAGCLPEYWDFTKAHYAQLNVPDWYEPLADSWTRYDAELRAETTLWSRLNWPLDQLPKD